MIFKEYYPKSYMQEASLVPDSELDDRILNLKPDTNIIHETFEDLRWYGFKNMWEKSKLLVVRKPTVTVFKYFSRPLDTSFINMEV